MISVLHVLDTENWAGTEAHVLTLAVNQQRHNLAIPLIACPRNSPLFERADKEGIKCFGILPGNKFFNLVRNALLIRRASRSVQVVHSHNGRGILLGICSGNKLVSTQHFIRTASADRKGVVGLFSRLISRILCRYVDRWIAISSAAREGMLERRECDESKVDLIFNGVEVNNGDFDRQSVRSGLGLDDKDVFVLCICRLEKEKNIALLLDIMESMPPHVRLMIAGDGSERVALEKRSLGQANRATFLGMRNDVPELLASCDFVVHPAQAEPFGLVLVEAMASAKAVVAYAAGGPLEIVVDRQTGLLVPPDSKQMFAEAVLELASNQALREELGIAGKQRFDRLFTAKKMASSTVATYQQVLNRA